MNNADEWPIISEYNCNDAEQDGILIQTSTLLPPHNGYDPHLVSHITTNLLREKQYITTNDGKEDYHRANIIDLLNQAGPKITSALERNAQEWFVDMTIEGPNGQRYKAFAQQNETGRWTLLLPEDY